MYEYRVIEAPAPTRRGWFGKAPSYAATLSEIINENALGNWEFQRAECGLASDAKLLIFRKKLKKPEEDLGEVRSFSDRLLEAETKSQRDERSSQAGRDYEGVVRPRRARVILDQAGTITERPENVEPDTIDLSSGSYENASAADRVTPFKPKAQASANA